jgi:SAM-dependent methyltransferase
MSNSSYKNNPINVIFNVLHTIFISVFFCAQLNYLLLQCFNVDSADARANIKMNANMNANTNINNLNIVTAAGGKSRHFKGAFIHHPPSISASTFTSKLITKSKSTPTTAPTPYHSNGYTKYSSKRKSLEEPNEDESNFGRQEYWNEFYESKDQFSWYSPWNDIEPFFAELVPLPSLSLVPSIDSPSTPPTPPAPPRVLLPGIGNDSSMVDMYDYGYTHLTAFDYAEEGVECAKKFFGHRLLQNERSRDNKKQQQQENQGEEELLSSSSSSLSSLHGVDLSIADARDLHYESNSFDAVLEKGTLDAIFLSGGKDKDKAREHLNMAVKELSRVVCKDGIVVSITAAAADEVKEAFGLQSSEWDMVRDGEFYMTEDGFCSNNIDASIFAWRRK